MIEVARQLRDKGEVVRLVSLYAERDQHLIKSNSDFVWLTWSPLSHTISEFLGIEIDAQFRFNESSEKSEAAFYDALKKVYRLPRKTLEQIYDSDVIRHFYNEAERRALIAKWAAK